MPIGVRDMGFNTATNLFLKIGMTTEEKIQQATKRIKELEYLIAEWKKTKFLRGLYGK